MADYPASIWTGNTRGALLSDAEVHTTWHDEEQAEIIAVQVELGLGASGGFSTVAARFADGLPKAFSAVGISVSGTFGGGEATTCTLAIPAQPVAGRLLLWGMQFVSKNAADSHQSTMYRDAVRVGQVNHIGLANVTANMQTNVELAASTAASITLRLERTTGTNNASVFADGRSHRIDALWLPT